MDSHKPLTAGEIEELGRLHGIVTQDRIEFPNRSPHYYEYFCRMMFDALPRLLSILPPPPDAAVREAVERLSAGVNGPWEGSGSMFADIRLLLRAVQAPRLTPEQVEAVRTVLDELDGYAATRELRAAFPEAFAGEVGE